MRAWANTTVITPAGHSKFTYAFPVCESNRDAVNAARYYARLDDE
jgi:hypothetical protein